MYMMYNLKAQGRIESELIAEIWKRMEDLAQFTFFSRPYTNIQ